MLLRLAWGVLAAGMVLAGCGGGSGEAESYEAVLHGLKRATESNSGFLAVEKAQQLKPAQRVSIDAFCETNKEMLFNREAWKAADTLYYESRIRQRAESKLPYVATGPIGVALEAYKKLFGLESFRSDDVRSYAKACYA